jgi:hypothetical protein
MSPRIIYIGIDDTDIEGGPGTGRVAKGLAQCLVSLGLCVSMGVSRHQLLIDKRVRCTTHNSSKGLALVTERPESDFYDPAINYMKGCFVEGSDPGLCICPEEKINPEIIDYAVSSKTKLLCKQDPLNLAAKYDIFLKELGGDGGGIIGALASVGLRAGGNDGRLVDLKGIKEIKGLISVAEVLEKTDIIRVQDISGNVLRKEEIIDSRDWLRPSLVDGQPVLKVKSVVNQTGDKVWTSVELKFKDMLKDKNFMGEHSNGK